LEAQQKRNEVKAAVCAYAYWNVGFFAKFFLGEYCLLPFSQMHFDLFQKNPERRGRHEVIAAPRGHAKTTIRSFIDIVHDICYRLEDYILIISETATVGDDRVRDLKYEIETNERIREYFGDLSGDRKWSETDFETSNGIAVTSKGRGKQVRGLVRTGRRPSKVVIDDIESKESVRNPQQREKVWNWIQQDVMRAGRVDGTTNFKFIGTFLHDEAALPQLVKLPGYRSKVYKAVLSWSNRQDLWEEWKDIYCNLEDDDREQSAIEFYQTNEAEMLDGVKVLWPAGMSYYDIQEAIINTGRYAVNSELQNEPHDPETQIFDMESAGKFSIEGNPGEEMLNVSGQSAHFRPFKGKLKPLDQMQKVLFLDPALGSDSGVSYPAIAVVARDDKNYNYVIDIWLDKVPPSRQVVQAFEMAEKWGVTTAGLETNLFKDYMRKDFEAEMLRRKQKGDYWQLNIIPVHQSANKEDRISALEPKVANGWLLFNNILNEAAVRSFEQFPTAAFNDAPDAVEGAYSLLTKPRTRTGKVAHNRQRKR